MVCNVWVWDNGNGDSARWRGTLGEGLKIEAVGDYNGDGKEEVTGAQLRRQLGRS